MSEIYNKGGDTYYQDADGEHLIGRDNRIIPLRMGDYMVESPIEHDEICLGIDAISGLTTLPGGGINPGELLVYAASREGCEETGPARQFRLVVAEAMACLENMQGKILRQGRDVIYGEPYKSRTVWRFVEVTGTPPQEQLPYGKEKVPEVRKPHYAFIHPYAINNRQSLMRPSTRFGLEESHIRGTLHGIRGATEVAPNWYQLAEDWDELRFHHDVIDYYCGRHQLHGAPSHTRVVNDTMLGLMSNLVSAEEGQRVLRQHMLVRETPVPTLQEHGF